MYKKFLFSNCRLQIYTVKIQVFDKQRILRPQGTSFILKFHYGNQEWSQKGEVCQLIRIKEEDPKRKSHFIMKNWCKLLKIFFHPTSLAFCIFTIALQRTSVPIYKESIDSMLTSRICRMKTFINVSICKKHPAKLLTKDQ